MSNTKKITKWNADRLRQEWIKFFQKKEHCLIPSASLFPIGDNTLLFTSAGMVPFKDYFLGLKKPPSPRVLSIQKCLRTTDLDSVGKTSRHCSFFEMLGNFSFSDYFKKEAIDFAWEFSIKHLKLDSEKIYISIFHEDKEAEKIWKEEIGIPSSRIIPLGKKDNWWGPVGEQGVCGPCSELYLDQGESFCENCNCKDKSKCAPGNEGDRFLEYWNLVFNEFYQSKDGTLEKLKKTGVDTGAGLERILALLTQKKSVYDTDEFQRIIRAIEVEVSKNPNASLYNDNPTPYRVLCDHLRASCFCMADGIFPNNIGRAYVVRRIIRRALLYARELNIFSPILNKLVGEVLSIYGETYPELKKEKNKIEAGLLSEEKRFLETLEIGLKKLDALLLEYKKEKIKTFSGTDIFLLYDTYGFPWELTLELVEKAGIKSNIDTFHKEMEKQKLRSTQNQNTPSYSLPPLQISSSQFIGYKESKVNTIILAIVQNGKKINSLSKIEDEASIILEKTPFYAEGGGQLGDQGELFIKDKASFLVIDTQKEGKYIVHHGKLKKGKLKENDKIEGTINKERRLALTQHHSATHLLNQALRETLGRHISQTGSLVASDHLRFDFSHDQKISEKELASISSHVNQAISQNASVYKKILPIEEAYKLGAVATFGEKYGESVRIVQMGEKGEHSLEFCGGCHVKNTKEIQFFHIVKEASPGAGNRRIEALAGNVVKTYFGNEISNLAKQVLEHNQEIEELKKTHNHTDLKKLLLPKPLLSLNEIVDINSLENFKKKFISLKENWETSHKEKLKLQKKLTSQSLLSQIDLYINQIQKIGPIDILSLELKDQKIENVRLLIDKIKEKRRGIIILAGIASKGKGTLVFNSDKLAMEKGLDMSKLILEACKHIEGKGGGRKDMAQAGGENVDGLSNALKYAQEEIKNKLQKL